MDAVGLLAPLPVAPSLDALIAFSLREQPPLAVLTHLKRTNEGVDEVVGAGLAAIDAGRLQVVPDKNVNVMPRSPPAPSAAHKLRVPAAPAQRLTKLWRWAVARKALSIGVAPTDEVMRQARRLLDCFEHLHS